MLLLYSGTIQAVMTDFEAGMLLSCWIAPMARAARHRNSYFECPERADVYLKTLAGAGGFEPPHGGIKGRS